MEDIVLRRAQKEDLDEIMKMQVSVFAGEQRIPAEIIGQLPPESVQWWCALDGAAIVGAIAAWEEEGQNHIGRFVVHPDCRGKHIGRRLVCFALDDLFSQGVEMLYMEAREVTVKIIGSLGGKVVGEPEEFYEGTVTPMTLSREDYQVK